MYYYFCGVIQLITNQNKKDMEKSEIKVGTPVIYWGVK